MKAKSVIKSAVMLAAAAYLARLAVLLAADWVRYDRMRAMSDEGPFSKELPRLTAEALLEERFMVKDYADFFRSAPSELFRYLKTESM